MEVWLGPELEAWIEEQVRLGRYPTAGEVIRDALWRLRSEEIPEEEAKAVFNKEIDEAIESLDRGEWVDPEDVRAELERMSAERRRKSA